MTALRTQLERFDGRHTAPLEGLASTLVRDDDTTRALCELAADARVAVAATWLLKRFADEGHRYSARDSARLVPLLDKLVEWQALLHVVQTVPALKITPARKDACLRALLTHLEHDNPFVRAWSYHGLVVLADAYADHRHDVLALVEQASENEKASVKARIRNVRKAYSWTQ